MSVPGPGWYSDASQGNRVRWWDGSIWSDGPAAPLHTSTPPPPPPPRKPSKLPKVLVASVIGVIVLIVVAVSGGFFQLVVLLGLLAAAIGAYAAAVGSAPRFRVRSRKIGAIVLGAGLFAATVGGTANAAVLSSSTASVASLTAPRIESPSSPTAEESPSPKPTPTPVVTQEEVREPVLIPFGSTTVNDANLAVGTTAISVTGVNGEKVIVHQVTYVDGVETERQVLREEITVEPVTQVTAVGTKKPVVVAPPAPPAAGNGCHPSYAGVCVPIASDVDCAGGSGNGPEYVSGPVRVVGPDEYDLERDNDGIACD